MACDLPAQAGAKSSTTPEGSPAMKIKLIVAAFSVVGLAACGPDMSSQSEATPPAADKQVAKASAPAAAPAAQEEKKEEANTPAAEAKKDDAAAPAAEAKKDDAAAPATDAKQGEGEKKSN
jgi:hypothetical protein